MIILKTEVQINGIRRAGRLLAQVLESLRSEVCESIDTLYLDGVARQSISDGGGRPSFLYYNGFPSAICASLNNQVIHGIPNKRPLKSGEILSLDVGVFLDGYYADSAITVPIGTVDERSKKLITVTEESMYRGIDAAKRGGRLGQISSAVYEHASLHGFGVVRDYCGHGVGIEVHEEPQIPNYPFRGFNPRLKTGMVLAIEPMINMGSSEVELLEDGWTVVTSDRSLSAHFEHTVAVLPDGPEILTKL